MSGGSPTLRRRRLGLALRQLRERAGLTGTQAANALERSPSWISRLEAGRLGLRGLRARDLHEILDLYGLTDNSLRNELQELAREAREQGWWSRYSELFSPDFAMFLGYENDAASICEFDSIFVPGLLQTGAYTRSILEAAIPPLTANLIESAVTVRLTRQRILTREDPTNLAAVIEEPALRRPIGEVDTRRGQLQALIAAADRPNIDLRIVPLNQMRYALTSNSFSVMRFREDPPVASVETSAVTLLHRDSDAAKYGNMFTQLQTLALEQEASVALLRHMLTET